MLSKLLFRNQDKKQLIIAMIGSFLGMAFLIASIHYLIKVNEFGEGADILGPNTIIVQKQVTTSSTLNLVKTDFSVAEIEKLKQEKFILDVKPVISNNFDVLFATADPLVPKFSSDVFIQTVDKDFLDVKSSEWHWKEGDTIVPIILPRDFLVMLNTFMSASGIPQISDELAKDIKFKLRISNETSEKEHIHARIIGFTNEVASILVPESFMKYGNDKYGNLTPQKITQLMISGTESEFGKVEEMLKERHLESKNSQMVVGRLKSIVGTLILVVLVISIIAVFVSCLVLIQYAQLLITKNAYEVRTLMRLGYAPKQLINRFFMYFIQIFALISCIGLGLFLGLKYFLDSVFEDGGIYIGTELSFYSIGALIAAFALFAAASYSNARKGIFKEF
ncbi:MAG: FtsX-like permease family protein [Bacteroidota bacterium]